MANDRNRQNAPVIDEQVSLNAQLRKLGMVADDSEFGDEQSTAALQTVEGEMYVTKDRRVHLVFDAIEYEKLTDYKNKHGQVSARRVALKFKGKNGAPVKCPVTFTTSEGEEIEGYYKLRSVHVGVMSLYPITVK